MLQGNNGQEEQKRGQAGKNVSSALLLNETEQIPTMEQAGEEKEEILFACTLVLTRGLVSGTIEAAPLDHAEYQGKEFPLNMELLHTTVKIMEADLDTSRMVRALAEVLISQEK